MRSKTLSNKKSGQMDYELKAMIAEFAGATSYLEIGARYGDTFYDVMRSLPKGSRGVCVDMPSGYWGSNGTEEYLLAACEKLRTMGYAITLILGDSTSHEIIEQVKSLAPFDACLIDGDHRYDGVKADWLNYGGLCRKVAFHDIVGQGQRHSEGVYVEVPRLWQEIKNANCKEFVADKSTMGIGIWTI